MIDKLNNVLWKIFGRFMQVATILVAVELMIWVSTYAYPMELFAWGIIWMIAIWPFCFFGILHDVINDKIDPIWKL